MTASSFLRFPISRCVVVSQGSGQGGLQPVSPPALMEGVGMKYTYNAIYI